MRQLSRHPLGVAVGAQSKIKVVKLYSFSSFGFVSPNKKRKVRFLFAPPALVCLMVKSKMKILFYQNYFALTLE